MICLVMMVRDEEAILRETLERVRPLIDRWAILDTGSVDHTPMIIEDVLAEIPGRLTRAVWTDFGRMRTRAFDEARSECEGAGWALVIDADSTVIHDGRDALAAELTACDSQHVELRHGGESWWMPCLLNLAHPWRWRGPVHEGLVGEAYAVPGPNVTSLRIEPRPGGARSRNPEKYLRDAEALAKAKESDPEWAPRYQFYEAQSWHHAGDDMRALEGYLLRANMVDGFQQERYISWLRAGDAHGRLSAPFGAQLECWYSAYEVDPSRPEALVRVAEVTRAHGLNRAAWLAAREAMNVITEHGPHGLFADLASYGWKVWFEVSVAAWWANEKQVGIMASARVLNDPGAPEGVRSRVQANLAYYA